MLGATGSVLRDIWGEASSNQFPSPAASGSCRILVGESLACSLQRECCSPTDCTHTFSPSLELCSFPQACCSPTLASYLIQSPGHMIMSGKKFPLQREPASLPKPLLDFPSTLFFPDPKLVGRSACWRKGKTMLQTRTQLQLLCSGLAFIATDTKRFNRPHCPTGPCLQGVTLSPFPS